MKLLWKTALALMALAAIFLGLFFGVGLARPLDDIPRFGTSAQNILITNVTIVDLERGELVPSRFVAIEKGMITRISDQAFAASPAGAAVIDGRGKYLIPGLWDAHLHTLAMSDRLHFPLMLANGVTAARNMGDGCSWSTDLDCVVDQREWQASAAAPYFVSTASYHIEELDNSAAASALVTAIKTRGDDMVKVQLDDDADPELFKAIVKASTAASIPVTGHVPANIDLTDAAYANFFSIEHDTQLMPHCPTAKPAQCDGLLAILAARKTSYVPTHVASSGQDVALARVRSGQDELLPYTNAPLSTVWRLYRYLHAKSSDAAELAAFQREYRTALNLTLLANRAGVPILAGSDSLDPFVLHGFSIHDELGHLVSAGLSPVEALRAATVTPATRLDPSRRAGLVREGYRADLVLLDRNPLDDVAATRAIHTVISNGTIFDPKERDAMLRFVKRQAASHTVNARAWWAILGF